MDTELETNSSDLFNDTLHDLESDPDVRKMEQFGQHHGNNTFQHCDNVARFSFYLAQKLGWRVDEASLATGAMLHDYYLYCTRDMTISSYRHGVGHPVTALENASQIWDLNDKERNIILSHMWPLTITKIPRSKEAFLVTLADKYCAMREFMADPSNPESREIHPGAHTPWIRAFLKRAARGSVSMLRGSAA